MSFDTEEDFYRENKTDVGKELYHTFRQIDRRLLIIPSDDFFSKEFILGYNCRLMKEYADQILDFSSEYDFAECPEVNGFYSWIRVINNFGSLVLSSFSRKGIRSTLFNKNLIRTSFIILSSLDVVLKIRSDSLAQENNSVLLSDAGSLVKKDHQFKTNEKKPAIDAEGQEEDGIIEIQKNRMTSDDNEEDGYTNDRKTILTDDSMKNKECSRNRSLFSLYESFMTEAILVYHESIHDPSLGLKDKLSLWSTSISLLANRSSLPLNQMISLGSSLLTSSISPVTNSFLGNGLISMLINNPIISIPYLSTSTESCATRKAIHIPGSEWVVNPGQKKHIYRRMDYNSISHGFGFNQIVRKKSSSDKNNKEIILFCSSSRHESCFDISCQTSLSSIEITLSNDSTCFSNDLQKLVDLYAWLMKPGVSSRGRGEEMGRNSCKQILGFKPEAVTLIGSGPEAGRTMMSLCLMIREINNVMNPNDIMKYPSRVFTINANFLSKLLMSPSRTLSFIKSLNGNLLPDTLSSLESSGLPPKASRRRTLSGRRTSSYPGAAFIKLSSERGITFPDGHVISLANLALMQAFSLVGMTKSSVYEALMLLKRMPFTLSGSIPFFSPGIVFDLLLHPLGFVSNRFTRLFNQHKEQEESEDTRDLMDEERESGDEYDNEFFYDSPSNVENWSNLSRNKCTRESSDFMNICEKIPHFNAAASNPFVSPLLFHDFASLKSIELNLITSHFDESLDDNISLARVWCGKVQIHVIQDSFIDLTLQQVKSKPVSTSDGHSIIINSIKSGGSYNRIK